MPGPDHPAPPSVIGSGAWPSVVVAIVGPTASGKSALGLELAQRLGGEIVNADAFQVYRGMDIGTAKPTAQERARVVHHLLDIVDVREDLSVAQFQEVGRRALADLAARGVPAVVVGGSGLYVRALLDDLRFPGSDPQIRARWVRELERRGAAALHAELAERDPEAAAHILPSNGRRLVRALEVIELTGQPFVAQLPPDGPGLVAHLSIGLGIERDVLDERIARRVDRMLADGLADEVRDLLSRGLREGRTAGRALGYPQAIDLVEGRLTQAKARESIVLGTRRFARRQQRWFGRDPRTVWLPATANVSSTASSVEDLVARHRRTLGP